MIKNPHMNQVYSTMTAILKEYTSPNYFPLVKYPYVLQVLFSNVGPTVRKGLTDEAYHRNSKNVEIFSLILPMSFNDSVLVKHNERKCHKRH